MTTSDTLLVSLCISCANGSGNIPEVYHLLFEWCLCAFKRLIAWLPLISVLTLNQGLRPLRPSVGPRQKLRLISHSADVVADNQRLQSALKKNKDSVARRDSENEDRQSDDSVEEIKEPAPKKSRGGLYSTTKKLFFTN